MSADAAVVMADSDARLARRVGHSPLRGFVGLTLAELRRWFPWRALTFAALGVAVLAFARTMWLAEEDAKLGVLLGFFFVLWIGVLVLTTVAAAQGAVASEVDEGTAAWLMAKPIGRAAFVLSKFVGAIPAVLVGSVGIPAVVARFVLVEAAGRGSTDFGANRVFDTIVNADARREFTSLPALPRYASLMALIATLVLLVVAVMVLLGCVVRVRAAVLGLGVVLPVGLLLIGTLLPDAIAKLTPGWLFSSIIDTILDDPAPALGPIVVTLAWIVVLLGAAVAGFSRREL